MTTQVGGKPPKGKRSTGKCKATHQDVDEDTGRRRGPPSHFTGMKLAFLEDKCNEYKAEPNPPAAGIFYTRLTYQFIDKFGYDYDISENPPDHMKETNLKPVPITTFPEEQRSAEDDRRNEYREKLRLVSRPLLYLRCTVSYGAKRET
jgi:hypothetical protein